MKKIIQISAIFVTVVAIVCILLGIKYYRDIYTPNVDLENKNHVYFYIHPGDDYNDVLKQLTREHIIKNKKSFKWVAELKGYPKLVKPGRYKIENRMTNNALINMLRGGLQTPVKVTFNNIRTREQLAAKLSENVEADSIEIINLLNDEEFAKKYAHTPQTLFAAFLPDTYEFYWTTSAENIIERIVGRYKKFWTDERKKKAANINLTPYQVSVLASIVQSEQTKYNDEKPTIAGLYINRIKRGIPLESDPTLVYAWGDFGIQRVYNYHKEIDSPFNTYRNKGLPPAPINLPAISSIKSVLNYQKHNYIFMCAKDDFSGYHNFSETYQQHLIYARKYHDALDKAKIK